MNTTRKIVGLSAILFLVTITTLFVLPEVTEEKEQLAFEYTIRAGDTCTKIAVNLGVSVISIVKANNLKKDCSNIYEGQVLIIPYPTPTPLGSPVATHRNIVIDCMVEKYTVKAGDTLDTIADRYKTSREVIANHNGLTENKVTTGMQLAIPLCYPTPIP